jgi:hypothetical protein
MEIKNKKMLLIGGGIAALGLITFLVVKSKNSGTTSGGGITSGCPSGQVPCSNNRTKCYDPMANYTIDPCKSISSTSSSDPIYQIVDGIIKLFKKKPTTQTV